ncbi:YbaN family protein [Paraferrimonas sp. SM1919]|uniref:YbaN family protein n=1 Tax=Paraferrimonas sp. SM1919 TaxID=2662263 RepID=UPI0013D70578|nr:YbaN family protein [Paraferrimonas sp. SM1919]
MFKYFYKSVGIVSLLLGFIGAFLPLLPTVPFILLSVYCFAKSDRRMHDYLVNHPWFKQSIDDWHRHRGMRLKAKIKASITIVFSFALSIYLVNYGVLKVMLLLMAVVLITFIARLPLIR